MAQNRVRIVDVADSLGLSTATVSKVIHGKTEKISEETVKRVQQELESSGYIPNMAGILLARNNSKIIGVVVNDHVKYEGNVLEDGFVMSSLNALSHEVNEKGYFLMIKTTSDIRLDFVKLIMKALEIRCGYRLSCMMAILKNVPR